MDNKLEKKLKDINEEDFIWFIFIMLFLLKIYSNKIEREYRIKKDEKCRKLYHEINEFTYIIAILIAIYYIYRNWKTQNRKVSIVTNTLAIISSIIFIYLELTSND